MLIKICGMNSPESLAAATDAGADMCGFIFHPGSPRDVSPERASILPSGHMRRVGVFVVQDCGEILRIIRRAHLHMAQLHGAQSFECAQAIGPDKVIRVLWPSLYPDLSLMLRDAEKWAPFCSMFLLDAGHGGGGSGINLAWSALAGLELPRPWLLAGGLSSLNIREALSQCHPDGLDFNSGVEESPGNKSAPKISAAIRLARMN